MVKRIKQIAASRANAQKSTGPRTPEVKAASRYNALKHGIYAEQQVMFDETAEDLAELDAELRDQYAPANPTERHLVDTLVHNEWRLRRMRRVEAVLWEHAAEAYLAEHPELETCNSADAFTTSAAAFERLQRVVNSCERNYHRALKELQSQQVARAHGLRSPQPEESTTASASSASSHEYPETAPISTALAQPDRATARQEALTRAA